jgi:hypothetical protein
MNLQAAADKKGASLFNRERQIADGSSDLLCLILRQLRC